MGCHESKIEQTPASQKPRALPTPAARPPRPAPKATSYSAVNKLVCVSDDWMNHTSMLTTLKVFDAAFAASPPLRRACEDDASRIVDEVCGVCRMGAGSLHGLVRSPAGGKKVDVALAFLLLLKYQSADGNRAVIEQIQDRAQRCESARKQAYTVLIQAAAAALAAPASSGTKTRWDALLPPALLPPKRAGDDRASEAMAAASSPLALVASSHASAAAAACLGDPAALTALSRVLECTEHFLDAHKLSAFKSAMHEPARLFYHLAGDHGQRDHVNVHGLNGYLCMVRGGLGCQMPLLPMEHDGDTWKGCGDVWQGLSETAWLAFADPSMFGKDMEAVLRRGSTAGFLRDRSKGSFAGNPNGRALEERAKKGDAQILPYVAKFAHFFSDDFLTRRMFEALNGEVDPAHAGYRKACDVLWPLYARDRGLLRGGRASAARGAGDGEEDTESDDADTSSVDGEAAESLAEHVYDEYFTRLDTQRVADFFRWLGVYKEATIWRL